jgi:hypothetical protein
MAERVREFLRTHLTDGVGQGIGLDKLEALLARAKVLADQQRVGVQAARAAVRHRTEVRRALQGKVLRYLRVVERMGAKVKGELANQFPLPPQNASQEALLSAARVTLAKATAEKDVLVSLGMSADVLDELAAAVSEFEQTLEATRVGRREHVGASADLEAVASEIAEQIQLLDGVVQYRLGDNAELMAAWHSARNVLGPFKPKGQQQDPGEGGSGTSQAA